MIEKPLIIIITMYALSFGLLSMQFMVGDVLGMDITAGDGTSIRPQLLTDTNVVQLNNSTATIVGQSEATVTSNPILAAATIAWELFMLLTGTYIFSLLSLFGVPSIFIAGMVILYVLMLSRTIIAYLRGV